MNTVRFLRAELRRVLLFTKTNARGKQREMAYACYSKGFFAGIVVCEGLNSSDFSTELSDAASWILHRLDRNLARRKRGKKRGAKR